MTTEHPNPAQSHNSPPNAATAAGIPGSGAPAHPTAAIPLPQHGFETLDLPVREIATIPAGQVISRAAVALMSAAAEKLGLSPSEEPDIDIAEARQLITALAGLLAAAQDALGEQREPMVEGLRTLQSAFREAAAHPDAPGDGPGERLLS